MSCKGGELSVFPPVGRGGGAEATRKRWSNRSRSEQNFDLFAHPHNLFAGLFDRCGAGETDAEPAVSFQLRFAEESNLGVGFGKRSFQVDPDCRAVARDRASCCGSVVPDDAAALDEADLVIYDEPRNILPELGY